MIRSRASCHFAVPSILIWTLLAQPFDTAHAAIPCLSGFVRSATGPLSGADLDFFNATTGEKLITPGDNSDALGFYNVCVLPGVYDVTFAPPPGTRLLGLRVPDIDLSAGIGQELDVTLLPGLVLDGLVTDRANGTGVAQVDIDVDSVSGGRVFTPGDNTAVAGDYRIVVPSGLYRLRFEPPLGSRLRGVEMDSVLVETDQAIDVSLESGHLLSGSVRSEAGQAIAAIGIELREMLTGTKVFLANNETDATGSYAVAVPTGLFELRYVPPRGAPYVAVLADSVQIAGDVQRDQALQVGHRVDIVAKDPSGATVELADVDVKISADGAKVFTPHDRTDVAGVAQIVLPSGTYDLRIDPPLGTTLDRIERFNVAIDADQTIEIVLPEVQRRTILARATDAFGAGIAGVLLQAHLIPSAVSIFIPAPISDGDGNFALSIPMGRYDVFLVPPIQTRWVPRELPSITVASDSPWGELILESGQFLTVHVTDAGGAPVPGADLDLREASDGARVFVPNDETDASGNAQMTLATGTYSIDVTPNVGSDYAVATMGPLSVANDTTITIVLPLKSPLTRASLRLEPPFPNPFRQQTVLNFEIGSPQEAVLDVFDSAGRRVRTFRRPASGAGDFAFTWDGRDDHGRPLSSGVYHLRLRTSIAGATQKVSLRK